MEKGQGPFEKCNYFLQAQPQPEDFFSSCFCIVPASVHSGHFLGLHLPSLVAPHFSHLNTAIFSPLLDFWISLLNLKNHKIIINRYALVIELHLLQKTFRHFNLKLLGKNNNHVN
jgi:hypothetical protein